MKASGKLSPAGYSPESDPTYMSYILDALKKVEHEKNKKRSDGRISLSNDLFQERKRPAGRSGVWKIVAVIASASLLACGATWYLLKGAGTNTAAVTRPTLPQPAQSTAAPAPTPAPVPVLLPAPAPSLPPVAATPTVPPRAAQKNAEPGGEDDSPARGARQSRKRGTAAPPVVQKQPVQTMQAPADIKLSGIAWQDERSTRRAVINGFLLKEGAVVSGAKIIDIQADKVRFSSPSGLFEIRLDGVLPSEVKR